MRRGRARPKMDPMLHTIDDGLPAAPAHSDPTSRAVSTRPVGVRRGLRPPIPFSRAREAVVGAAPAQPRAGRRWS
jgi:hypothetical protein